MSRGVRLCITGSEVMNGFVLDRNTQFFASELYSRGFELRESRIIHDDAEHILRTWREYAESGDIIVNSGGLGPTTDDLTVDLLCEWTGDTPVYEPYAERRTRYFFEKRAKDKTRTLSIDVALRQARIPSRAKAIKNTVGLAPGIYLPDSNFIALPGFPDEIRGMWQETLSIFEQIGLNKRATRIYPVWGVGESQLFSTLPEKNEVTVGVHALPWGCRLFLRQSGENSAAAAGAMDEIEKSLHGRYPGQIVEDPLNKVIATMIERKETLAVAESCTGGLAAKQLTDTPGVSAMFQGGVVSYANSVKGGQLAVPADVLQTHGAVSAECAAAMARGVAENLDSDWGISFTGIAGPDGGTESKPVGTVFISIFHRKSQQSCVARFYFPFGRERFRNAVVACGWLSLWQFLTRGEGHFPLTEYKTVV